MAKPDVHDQEMAEKVVSAQKELKKHISQTIVGQEHVVDQLLISLFAQGHSLLVGVPGLAKTLLVSTLAKSLALSFNRIQFTPDLMPSDITGTEVIQENKSSGERGFKFIQGPIFSHVLLADEINRTPPKTQAALLQAMQEKKVTIAGHTYDLPHPFFVLATQNPIEQEGTYPLPEAQLDRFLLQINVGYPKHEEEKEIVSKIVGDMNPNVSAILSDQDIISLQSIIRRVPVADSVVDYAVRLVRSTRPHEGGDHDVAKKWISWGAGPRASQSLVWAAKARSLLAGQLTPSVEDVRELFHPVLRHRIVLSFQAEAEGMKADNVLSELLTIVR